MSGFLTELEVQPCDKSDAFWILAASLIYASDFLGRILGQFDKDGKVIPAIVTLLKGFHTDLASIPFGIKWAHREGALHDGLFRKNILVPGFAPGGITFRQANYVFFEAMESRGKGSVIKWVMFSGVWIGGWPSYHTKLMNWIPVGDAARAVDGLPCEPTAPIPVQTPEEKASEVH